MPQALGAAIITALGATATATTASIVGSVVIAGVLTGAQLLLAPKPDIPKPQDGKVSLKQPIPPAIYAYGRCRISGAYLAYELKGSTSHDVIALHQGQIDAFEKFYLHDDLVVFDDGQSDGAINLAVRGSGRYRGYLPPEPQVWIYWRKGMTPETPYPLMVEAFPATWTANHRCDGIATIHLKCAMPSQKQFGKRFPFGLPKPSAVGRWRLCWDPRDPSQSLANPLTWKWTDNPVVCLLDFFCHHPAGYLRPVAEVFQKKSDWWFAAMDLCDEQVTKADGTSRKRYTCGGQFTSETPRKSVVEALLRSCDGWLCEYGDGSVVVYGGGYFPPAITIEDRHIYDLRISRGRLPDERVTRLNLSVSSPDHDYNPVPCDPWLSRRAQDVGAPTISRDVKAEWVQDWGQMRALGKIEDEKVRCDVRGTLVGRQYCENLRGRRYFMLNCTQQNSTRMVPCEVLDFVDNSFENGSYEIEFQSVDPALRYDWNPATDEGKRPAIPDRTDRGELPIPPSPTLSIIRQTVAGVTFASISATSPPVEGWPDLTLAGEYRKQGGSDSSWIDLQPQAGKLQCLSGAVEDGVYQVRVKYVGGGGSDGDFSPIGEIAVVTDNLVPAPPVEMRATGATLIDFGARTGDSKNNASIEFVRRTPAQTYEQGLVILTKNAGPNIVVEGTDNPGAGAFLYQAKGRNPSGVPSVASPAVRVGVSTEGDAVIARTTTAPIAKRASLIRYTVARLVAEGIWPLLDAFYVLAGANQQIALLNWKQNAFNLTANGTLAFVADRGCTSDGSTGFLQSGFNPTTAGQLYAQDDAHLGVYLLTDVSSSAYDIGASSALIRGKSSSATGIRVNNAVLSTYGTSGSPTPGKGHILGSRASASSFDRYLNGASIGASATTSVALSATTFRLCGADNGGGVTYSPRQVAAGHWGRALTAAQAAKMSEILAEYLADVGAI